MAYQVDYFDAQGPAGSDVKVPTYAEARALVEKAIAAGIAQRIEVRDANGEVRFRRPRTVRRA